MFKGTKKEEKIIQQDDFVSLKIRLSSTIDGQTKILIQKAFLSYNFLINKQNVYLS